MGEAWDPNFCLVCSIGPTGGVAVGGQVDRQTPCCAGWAAIVIHSFSEGRKHMNILYTFVILMSAEVLFISS